MRRGRCVITINERSEQTTALDNIMSTMFHVYNQWNRNTTQHAIQNTTHNIQHSQHWWNTTRDTKHDRRNTESGCERGRRAQWSVDRRAKRANHCPAQVMENNVLLYNPCLKILFKGPRVTHLGLMDPERENMKYANNYKEAPGPSDEIWHTINKNVKKI